MSHFQRATVPVTTIDRTIKKYSSGMEAAKGSKSLHPRITCSRVEYLSMSNTETSAPGKESSDNIVPTPMPISGSASPSP